MADTLLEHYQAELKQARLQLGLINQGRLGTGDERIGSTTAQTKAGLEQKIAVLEGQIREIESKNA